MSFVFKARRRAQSRAYVTVAATPKTDSSASRIGKLFLDGSYGAIGSGIALNRSGLPDEYSICNFDTG